MKKRLTGKITPLNEERTKWDILVNLSYDKASKSYPRRRRTFYGNSREAKAFLRDFIAMLEAEEQGQSSQPIGDWLDYWLDNYGKPIYNWENNTYERAERIVENNIKPYIGEIPLSALEPNHILDLYSYLRRMGKVKRKKTDDGIVIERGPLAARTVKYVHTILNQALKEAVKLRKIADNPCIGLAPANEKRRPHTKWVVLNAEQLKAFLQKIINHQDYALIHTAAYSGARQSELLGLEKDCIIWDKASIRIEQTLHLDDESEDGFELRPRTKNDTSTRTVKLSSKAMKVLKEHVENRGTNITSNLVFTDQDGQPIDRKNLGHRFSSLAQKHGHKGMTFHHLRHTHATILLANGAYINDVAKRLGHTDPKITLSVYGHCMPEGEDALVKKFDTLLGDENG